ncbi:unnamed protein product [Acanthoscelides obtectus]|uniref:Palmitoyltransferase n=1 Tax=Acanthoscelides obtectus TaxID=200917 RepID=A0A9P0M353_ACAOB|nr:unnamed protein product [Acanthoscelides obtectus]CAH2006629.1 unnamed protein product [Acanthoscelides obtectus]CAK1631315.1 Palmitoyltransferase ZDHHC6 [Acanthoscelides obtectus]CAK1668535.1 Palmitoyltransferase ZDHHC6 [Acanthoscelides obtectus]
MCITVLRKICHWGPLTAIGIIKLVTAMTIHCMNMLWPKETLGGKLNYGIFIILSGLTLFNFLSSMYHGAGYLPLNWRPCKEEDCQFLQMCGVCDGYKAPRSHHCRKCGRCVLKMDHHCPWINNCVGWGNHAHFTCFLLSATLGCAQAAVILCISLYHSIYYRTAPQLIGQPRVHLGLYGTILCVFALGFSIGVVIAVGMLLWLQVRAIIRNRTGIEDWILAKANFRRSEATANSSSSSDANMGERFVFPYDLGIRRNIQQVMNWTCQPVGDGIHWPVQYGCDQYTLTREQLAQKNEKRLKTRLYTIFRPVSGYWFPIFSHGIRVCLNFPCTDEPRIKLAIGDKVQVTRWRKHWLFGELVQQRDEISTEERNRYDTSERVRGWFPRRCAVETNRVNYKNGVSSQNNKKID